MSQRNAKTGPPSPLQIGKPFPDDHAILWAPVEGLTRSMELSQPAIIITQGALREVIRHLSSSSEQELLGFLIGEPCECPNTHRRFLSITGTLRTGHAIAEDDPVQIPDAEWLGQQLEVRRRRSTLIGWYHSTPYLSPSPPRLDLATHRERFTEAWQCGLVIATEGNGPAGGFFRTHADPAQGGAYVPFYEQVDDDGILEGGTFRTLIDWNSYSTSELTERDENERSVHMTSIARRSEPEADAEPTALPLMIPQPAIGFTDPPPARSRWVGLGIVTMVALAITFAAVQIWDARRLPEPPMVALPHARETPAAPTAAEITAQQRADSIANASAVIARGTGALPTPAAAQRNATSVAATPAPLSAPPAPAPASGGFRLASQLRFDSLADSLEHSLHNYRDRRVDFGQKRLSCKELSYGYRAADEALVGLAKLAGDTRALDPVRKARYTQLIAGMDTVNDDFDASKCKRV